MVLIVLAPIAVFLVVYFAMTSLRGNDAEAAEVRTDDARRRPRFDADDCSICMDGFSWRLETNCGHSFCTRCFMTFVDESGGGTGGVACPMCRGNVHFVDELFSEPQAAETASERGAALARINEYNTRNGAQGAGVVDQIRDTPMLLRHLARNFGAAQVVSYAVRLRTVVLVLVALVYALSPLDIIPEGVFGLLGFVDDALVPMVVLVSIASAYRAMRIANTAR